MDEQLVLCMLKRRLYIIMTNGRMQKTLFYDRLALEKERYARNEIENQDEVLIQGINQVYAGHSTVTSVTCFGSVVCIDTDCSFDDGALIIIELNTPANISVSMRAV